MHISTRNLAGFTCYTRVNALVHMDFLVCLGFQLNFVVYLLPMALCLEFYG